MNQVKLLNNYCKNSLLDFNIKNEKLYINNKVYNIFTDNSNIFDEDFEMIPNYNEDDGLVYEFGGRWYVQNSDIDEVTLTELKYIGKAKQKLPTESFLGIHSGNELLNGLGLYKDWISKAKFLGIKNLGICEKNTLAGVIEFQNICIKNDIKPIFGMTITIYSDNGNYDIKLYVRNFQGWLNLLKLNKIINVNETHIVEEDLIYNLDGLIPILDPKTTKFEDKPNINTYYQLDTVIFENEDIDKLYIDNLEKYLKSDLEPILITDAYYLEQKDWEAREIVWKIAKSYDFKTKNQYFKNHDQFASELINMFDPSDKSWVSIFKTAKANLEKVVNKCNFKYDTVNRRLPKYKMTESESSEFKNNEQLFLHLIKKGFSERKIQHPDKYIDRLKEEIRVLKKGDVIDYFLILHDIIKHSHKEDILVGIGRGSAGGSLVSYLLGIIQINPIEFDLLFERFLNDGRMGRMEECEAYEIETNSGEIVLNEGSMVKVIRNSKELIIFVEDLKKNDEILNYN